MKNYAMVLGGKVIEVIHNQYTIPVWPPDNEGNQVIAIECDNTVERGMLFNMIDETFSYPEENNQSEEEHVDTFFPEENLTLNVEYIMCLLEEVL